MRCVICKGALEGREVDVPTGYKGRFLLIKGVEAQVCAQCGEVYLSPASEKRVNEALDKVDGGKLKAEPLGVIVEYP